MPETSYFASGPSIPRLSLSIKVIGSMTRSHKQKLYSCFSKKCLSGQGNLKIKVTQHQGQIMGKLKNKLELLWQVYVIQRPRLNPQNTKVKLKLYNFVFLSTSNYILLLSMCCAGDASSIERLSCLLHPIILCT